MKTTLSPGDVGADVAMLQRRLNGKGATLAVDHIYGTLTTDAVRAFQRERGLVADGVAGPRTLQALLGGDPDARALTQADIDAAATTLECDPAAIHAVIAVEAPLGGYLPDGRVTILYERHVMYRLLRQAGIDPASYSAARPDIVNPKPGGYLGGAAEYGRLAAAKQINEDCALQSCSWGRFQIMGFHYAALGYDSAPAFVADMAVSEARQLAAFVKFVAADTTLLQALRDHDWQAFARGYNGPNYTLNHYDSRLAHAYYAIPTTADDAQIAVSGSGSNRTSLAVPEPPPPVDVGGNDFAAPRPKRRKGRASKATT